MLRMCLSHSGPSRLEQRGRGELQRYLLTAHLLTTQ